MGRETPEARRRGVELAVLFFFFFLIILLTVPFKSWVSTSGVLISFAELVSRAMVFTVLTVDAVFLVPWVVGKLRGKKA